MNSTDTMPRARNDGLVVQEVENETLVFDKQARQVHCLNQLAGVVWRHCDGKKSNQDLAGIVQKQLNLPADTQLIELALEELAQAKLLEGFVPASPERKQYTRRDLALRFGVGAAAALLAVPLVTSMASAGSVGLHSPLTTRAAG